MSQTNTSRWSSLIRSTVVAELWWWVGRTWAQRGSQEYTHNSISQSEAWPMSGQYSKPIRGLHCLGQCAGPRNGGWCPPGRRGRRGHWGQHLLRGIQGVPKIKVSPFSETPCPVYQSENIITCVGREPPLALIAGIPWLEISETLTRGLKFPMQHKSLVVLN